QVRKNIGDMRHTLPAGVIGPGFNDAFGDTFGTIYGFTSDGYSHRELRDFAEAARSRLLLVPDVAEIEVIGAQTEQGFLELSAARCGGLGLRYADLGSEVKAQNRVQPAGVLQTGEERICLRVSGAFEADQDIRAVNLVAGERIIPLREIVQIRRGYADPPLPL